VEGSTKTTSLTLTLRLSIESDAGKLSSGVGRQRVRCSETACMVWGDSGSDVGRQARAPETSLQGEDPGEGYLVLQGYRRIQIRRWLVVACARLQFRQNSHRISSCGFTLDCPPKWLAPRWTNIEGGQRLQGSTVITPSGLRKYERGTPVP
jgi:hypothetical protein